MANEQLKQKDFFNPDTEKNDDNIYWADKYVSGTPDENGVFESKKIKEVDLRHIITGEKYTEVLLDASDILSLNWLTGFEILPSPGLNKYYSKIKIIAEYSFGTTTFTGTDGSKWLDFYYAGFDSFVAFSLLDVNYNSVTMFDVPMKRVSTSVQDGASPAEQSKSFNLTSLNSPLELYYGTLNDAQITNGDGSLLLKIWYKIETFGNNL